MGRGQQARGFDGNRFDTEPREHVGAGWTKQELLDAAGMSGKSFDVMRKSARVKGPSHGGLTHVFDPTDLIMLIQRAESGKYSERGGPIAAAWRVLLTDAGLKMPQTISRGRR